MSGLTTPVGPLALPAIVLAPPGPAGAPPNLAAFLDLMTGQTPATPTLPDATGAAGERQADAAPGTSLPDKDADADPALAWMLAPPLVPAQPRTVPTAVAPAVGDPAQASLAPPTGPSLATNPLSTPEATVDAPVGDSDRRTDPAAAPAVVAMASPLAIATATTIATATARGIVPAADATVPMPEPSVARSSPRSVWSTVAASQPAKDRPGAAAAAVADGVGRPLAGAPPLRPGRGMPQVAFDGLGDPNATPAPATTDRSAIVVPLDPASTASRAAAASSAAASFDRAGNGALPPAAWPNPAAAQPVAGPSVGTSMAPARSAILPALFALAPPVRQPAARGDDEPGATSLDAAGLAALRPADMPVPIAPAGDAQRAPLDMGRQDWPQKMIEHIAVLRDNADATDTAIRLKPDALGRVDIALRTHDGGAVSVHFTAEQPATRTLIADAAPQLREAAEARGLRLAETSVDLSGQGHGHRARPEADRRQPITNHLATTGGDDIAAVTDGRIA